MRTPTLAALLLAAALFPPGCGSMPAATPPDWAWFDVVDHPTGGIPATLGFYAGEAVWFPVGLVTGALIPYPADEVVWIPGEVLGTGLGLVLGAPGHLIALPFPDGDEGVVAIED